ncbi:DUF2066 domain-containing protein [Pseudomaricurvus sp. HS19]|uniref:DUF2066 domain-containing protein n=1 Tax=Pseudomaricurvus sp. HS19 TaxID=2692626 RepID=UPI00137103FB|nr:DUF2066 domain-containing protein [Pseudomaricurvus sp. HS19]
MKYWVVCVWLLLASVVPAASAEEVKGLYQQDELVANQSDSLRRKAASEALSKVIVRVSGRASVLGDPAVAAATADPLSYLEAYRYESTGELIVEGDEELPATRLVMSFSGVGIERLLRRNNLPVWPANRPAVLLWLVSDDLKAGRQLVELQGDSDSGRDVRRAAAERGLPLVLPLLDLQDKQALKPQQAWSMDQKAVTAASARYSSDAVLVGRFSHTASGRWLSDWSLLHKGEKSVFDADGSSQEQVIRAGLAAAAEKLASLYAVVSNGAAGGELLLEVDAVNGFAAWQQVVDYLQGLEAVQQLTLERYQNGMLTVQLKLAGDPSQLTAVLDLDRRLLPVSLPKPEPQLQPVDPAAATVPAGEPALPRLRYRWSR